MQDAIHAGVWTGWFDSSHQAGLSLASPSTELQSALHVGSSGQGLDHLRGCLKEGAFGSENRTGLGPMGM